MESMAICTKAALVSNTGSQAWQEQEQAAEINNLSKEEVSDSHKV